MLGNADVVLIGIAVASIVGVILLFGLNRYERPHSTDVDLDALKHQHHQLMYVRNETARGFTHAPYCWCGKGICDDE